MRKPMFCICENKDADQLRGNPLLSKSEISSHLMWLYSLVCVGPGQKPECWFSHDVAHLSLKMQVVGAHLIHLKEVP